MKLDSNQTTNLGAIVSAVGGILSLIGFNYKPEGVTFVTIGIFVLIVGIGIIGYFSNKFKNVTNKVLNDVDEGIIATSNIISKIDPSLGKSLQDVDSIIKTFENVIQNVQAKVNQIQDLSNKLPSVKQEYLNSLANLEKIVSDIEPLIKTVVTVNSSDSSQPSDQKPEEPKQ